MLALTGQALVAGAVGAGSISRAANQFSPEQDDKEVNVAKTNFVCGEIAGAKIGEEILARGGNAVDAVIAAALAAGISSPSKCGAGAYGGHMVIALAGGKKIVSIDFNPPAPALARSDIYPLDEKGKVIGGVNFHGWLAAGVPGVLAGMQLAIDRYGTKSFRELVAPAIELAERGIVLPVASVALASKLFKIQIKPGDKFRNPKMAKLLKTLAKENSVESFYRGDIAKKIGAAFKKNHGLVRFEDLAAYHAAEVEPLKFSWGDFTMHTAPLTAGGLTMLEMFSILRTLGWQAMPDSPQKTHARLEAQRLAWKDRLDLLGDPEKVSALVEELLSENHSQEAAKKILMAVHGKKALSLQVVNHVDEGTVNISAADSAGNMVAMTLSHGHGFGAQVIVEEFGMPMGHGLSRFVPKPGHPNSIAPGKKPLHNMCPTIVTRGGKPVLAVGGAGGVLIPNSVFNVLLEFVVHGATMEQAVAAPRLQTIGTIDTSLEKNWPQSEVDYLKSAGFKTRTGLSAYVSAVSFDPKTGGRSAVSR